MITFVPLENYYDIYIYFALFLVLANVLHAYTVPLNNRKNISFLKVSGIILLFGLILYIGLRPISGRYFGDMNTYSKYFFHYANGGSITTDKDLFFHYYVKTLSMFTSVYGMFLTSAFIYIYPMYKLSKKLFPSYWFYMFFVFVVSFSFWSYGTNGIRNGLATSLFLWGLCYRNNKVFMSLFFIVAAMFHKTTLLPIAAYCLTMLYNKPRLYFLGWLASIPLSLVMGSVWISLFASLGFGDDRLAGYLTGEVDASAFSSTGFRWDFVIYSASAVFVGWYFIYKKKFNDKFYNHIFNTYLICNAFWILVIRANFSNRFAYLSWFLIGLVIIYPFIKQKYYPKQAVTIAKVIVLYFSFTFLMYFVYYAK
ncbi:EpsG family protein [Cellulophaga sp. 20_2_10]|uniref:EpsG family protein n=1 Tax=Cellulophaga sp. 20_2_10 TaxID=2942476 RepID=UPI00201A9024|nr:EpsG family protein [Cellulophaga sp. 20_2_10]MCL5244785.1 EpsG family protein [Cellulophaga sp. 20_2_10]